MSSPPKDVKIVVVGDGMVGKTCLCLAYRDGNFPAQYNPTIFDTYHLRTTFDNEHINVSLWDTAGQEDFDRLRPISYSGADAVLLCFNSVHPQSFSNILEVWYPEIHHYVPGAKIILVATQMDKKTDPMELEQLRRNSQIPITRDQAESLKNRIKAHKFFGSCFWQNISDLFNSILELFSFFLRMLGKDNGEC